MGAATQVTDFSDLYTDLQNRVREETGVTATENIAKRFINIGLHDMHVGFGELFPWCERRAKLVTQPTYTTGLVQVSQGGTTLTGVADADGNSTEWNTANDFSVNNMRVGGKILITGGPEVYEISAVGSDTSGTIDAKWVKSTIDATTQTDNGAAYTYFEDEYALASDYLRPIDKQNFDNHQEIRLIDRTQFRRRFPNNSVPGRPVVATIVDLPFNGSTAPVRKVRFFRPPEQAYVIPYTYVTSNLAVASDGTEQTQLVSDDDEPIVPLQYRHLIVLHGLFNLYRDRKDDARSQEVKAEFVDLATRITSDVEIGSKRTRINPNMQRYWTRARRPWAGGLGRYDINGYFDRMER